MMSPTYSQMVQKEEYERKSERERTIKQMGENGWIWGKIIWKFLVYHFYNFSVGFKEPQSKKLEIKMFMELVSVSLGKKKNS